MYEVAGIFAMSVSRFHNRIHPNKFYWAYVDYDIFAQDLIAHVLKIKSTTKINFQGTDLDFTPPFTRLPFAQAIEVHSSDIDTISAEEELSRR